MIDPQTINILAKTLEIDGFSVVREYLQIKFLNEFYKNTLLRKTYFKGGTALRLLYDSSRFSEDLDFTTSLPVSTIKSILNQTIEKLKNEFSDLSIKELKTLQGYSSKLYLPTSFAKHALTVKLDFSLRESVLDPLISPISSQLPIGGISLVEHLSDREILAEKIRALLHRSKGRDLFDFWFLLNRQTPLDTKLITQKFKFYKETYESEKLQSVIQNWNEKELDQDLRRFLPQKERKIIPQLKRLVIEYFKKYVENKIDMNSSY